MIANIADQMPKVDRPSQARAPETFGEARDQNGGDPEIVGDAPKEALPEATRTDSTRSSSREDQKSH
jgi:hypothetical protein